MTYDRFLIWLRIALMIIALFWMAWIFLCPPFSFLSPSQTIQAISEP